MKWAGKTSHQSQISTVCSWKCKNPMHSKCIYTLFKILCRSKWYEDILAKKQNICKRISNYFPHWRKRSMENILESITNGNNDKGTFLLQYRKLIFSMKFFCKSYKIVWSNASTCFILKNKVHFLLHFLYPSFVFHTISVHSCWGKLVFRLFFSLWKYYFMLYCSMILWSVNSLCLK